jgi:hypothetical protein
MKFSHRGANYNDAPSMLEVTEREIGNMSRGQKREFPYLRHIPEPLPLPNRQFRSVTYCTAQPTASESTVATPRVITIEIVVMHSIHNCVHYQQQRALGSQ